MGLPLKTGIQDYLVANIFYQFSNFFNFHALKNIEKSR